LSALETVLADLRAESEQLDSLVDGLDPDGWARPTPADGWDVAHQIAHLAWTDESAVKAATDLAAWDEIVLRRSPTSAASSTARPPTGRRRRPPSCCTGGGPAGPRWRRCSGTTHRARSCPGTARR